MIRDNKWKAIALTLACAWCTLYAIKPAWALKPLTAIGYQISAQAACPIPAGKNGVWVDSGTANVLKFRLTGGTDTSLGAGGGAGTGNWTFSGNNADLTGAATLGIGNTTATAISIGGAAIPTTIAGTATFLPRGMIIATATAPTCAINANAGTTATCNGIAGTDSAFKLVVTSGGTGGAVGTWFTVNFNGTWAHKPICVNSEGKAGDNTNAYIWGYDYAGSSTTTAKFSLTYGTNVTPGAVTFSVICIDPGV